MSNIQPINGMENQMQKLWNYLIKDEKLLRLLYYTEQTNPLDDTLPNLVDPTSTKYWKIVDDRLTLASKDSEISKEIICRVTIETGRRRPIFGNDFVMRQNFLVRVIVHEKLVPEFRLEQIGDRINQLLLQKQGIAGYGKIGYTGGDPYQAPVQYQMYVHNYNFMDKNKVTC